MVIMHFIEQATIKALLLINNGINVNQINRDGENPLVRFWLSNKCFDDRAWG